MTSTTATVLLIDPKSEEVIIGVRSNEAWVYPGKDSLPGGFMEARFTEESQSDEMLEARHMADVLLGMKYNAPQYSEGEDSKDCAIREVKEEMGILLHKDQLILFDVRANSRTDTRAHVTNVCYYAVLTPEQSHQLPHGLDVSFLDDLDSIKRWKFDEVHPDLDMAFNHIELLTDGLAAYKKALYYEELEFRMSELSI